MTKSIKKVLIIDDDKVWLNLLIKLVSKYYDNIDAVSTLEEALSKVEHNIDGYDLVVTDIRLNETVIEGIEGLELIEKLVNVHKLKKSIIVTCHPSLETKKKANSLGALYFIKGKFSREEFWESLANLVKEQSALVEFPPNETRFSWSSELLYTI